MDTKRLILSITLTLSVLLGYQLLWSHLRATHPNWDIFKTADNTPATQPTDAPVITAANPTTGPTTLPSQIAATMPILPGGLAAVGTTQPVAATLGTDTTAYPMVFAVDPQGAGLSSVTLSDYYVNADRKEVYTFEKPTKGYENVTRPLATRTVTIDGTDIDMSNVIWQQMPGAAKDSVTYKAAVFQNGLPVLEISKQFTLLPRDAKDGSGGFDVQMNQTFRNLTPRLVKVHALLNGPTPPARENDLSEDRRYVAGYDNQDKDVAVPDGTLVSELKKEKLTKDLVATDKRPMLWVGACNSYFESIVRPDYSGQPGTPAIKIAAAVITGLNPDNTAELPTSLSLDTSDFVLAPLAEVPLNLHVFFGPKKRDLLDNAAYYSKFPMEYGKTLVFSSGWCGFITFSWLITILSGILWFFHLIFRDWGLAIIGLVCLVRLLLHPITKKAQVNMVGMGKMAPEIERLKKKYGDDKDGLNKAMIGVYKEQGMVPILGCLPMFLQTPIWIALWSALQSTFELRQAGFLRWQHFHLTWISDLSRPDALISFNTPVNILFFHISSLNILPILLAVVFFLQQHFQPMPGNMTPEQQQQRKMMKWMSLLFPVMLYSRASGLSLYIVTSSTIGIVENKIIRDHIKERDEAAKAGIIIVDAPPTRNSKKGKDDKKFGAANVPAKKKGGLAGWMADLKAKAEEFQREAERRNKDRA